MKNSSCLGLLTQEYFTMIFEEREYDDDEELTVV